MRNNLKVITGSVYVCEILTATQGGTEYEFHLQADGIFGG